MEDQRHSERELQDFDNNNAVWLDNKQEFPDIFDSLPTPIRKPHKKGKVSLSLSKQSRNEGDRPLYSTIVKTACSSIAYVYSGQSFQLCHEAIAF